MKIVEKIGRGAAHPEVLSKTIPSAIIGGVGTGLLFPSVAATVIFGILTLGCSVVSALGVKYMGR